MQGAPRFCKPRFSAPQPPLRTATIKTFLREYRGFANLESAHKNNNFVQTKLNPFETFLAESSPCRAARLACFFSPAAVSLCCCRNIFQPPSAAVFSALQRCPLSGQHASRAVFAVLRRQKKRRKAALFIQLHRILPFQSPSTLAKLTKCTKNRISPLTEPFFCVILSPTKKEMHNFISSLDFNERMAYHMRFSFQSALCFDRMFRPGHEQCVGLSLCRSIG